MNLKLITPLVFFALISACTQAIKNDSKVLVDEVLDTTILSSSTYSDSIKTTANVIINNENDLLGYWVGDFEQLEANYDIAMGKQIMKDERINWNRTNKINISLNKFVNDKVYGHSVVAGNHRPFEGTFTKNGDRYSFDVKEPGDDKYDGQFRFEITSGDSLLTGTWTAYKNIDIKQRKYELQKKSYLYNPNQPLLQRLQYVNWDKEIRMEFMNEIDEEEFLDFSSTFETATDEIYTFNASNSKLRKEDVENLKQGDLFIIRNTIYARHGYSFKNRPLRVFFDAQPWYIPVHNNIKKDLTDLEKENIKLLMKYEKNALAYYDSFGRG